MLTNLYAYLGPYSVPVFRKLLGAALVSGIGDALIPIAFAIESHRVEPSGWGFTLVLLSLWLGRLLGMLIVRHTRPAANPVSVMITSDIVRFSAQIGLFIWLILHADHNSEAIVTITAFSISSGIYGLATAFIQPARFNAMAHIIPSKHRTQANSWMSIFGDTLSIVGPLVSSVIMISIGFKSVLLIDALSFLIGILMLTRIKVNQSGHTTDKIINTENEIPHINNVKLPRWINVGFMTWLFVALTIGILGTAGPTFVIDRNSSAAWAVAAACMATGSLAGSAISLLGVIKSLSWKQLQLLACFSLAAQILCFLFVSVPLIVWVSGFFGSALVTVSGIRWDTIGQSVGSDKHIHAFAVRDQAVHTIGIPAGMLIFGVSTILNSSAAAITIVAAVVATMGIFIATVKTPDFL
ncbi:MFS transporter [Acidithiobacillus sp.]|jgi:MFS family permease|uniref:MFS transporter n=1 Tax=Acidithiobacillus sp. TaxID=1872118 RepID=UPI0025C72ADC|nr:MFS transporter [Acidithiobacillus sp.]MCK9188478.1 MFS transporter [Acidithiobacillus sp.]MCK9358899.1 MFS transporter [Acidithiobacillus sp.]